jgi:mRNA interferase MazF
MPDRGDLVLIPYPFTYLSASKRRPVLALTSADAYGDFIGLPVTSRPRPESGIPLVQADMEHGILPVASWIRTDRIVTLNATLALKTVGRVRERLVAEAVERLYARIRGPAAR